MLPSLRIMYGRPPFRKSLRASALGQSVQEPSCIRLNRSGFFGGLLPWVRRPRPRLQRGFDSASGPGRGWTLPVGASRRRQLRGPPADLYGLLSGLLTGQPQHGVEGIGWRVARHDGVEQSGFLQRLDVGQIAQRGEAERARNVEVVTYVNGAPGSGARGPAPRRSSRFSRPITSRLTSLPSTRESASRVTAADRRWRRAPVARPPSVRLPSPHPGRCRQPGWREANSARVRSCQPPATATSS